MPKPDNVPEHLWISDSHVSRHAPGGRKKIAWTPDLLARCQAMHEAGETHGDIARMIEQETGVRVSRSSVQDYLAKHE